MKEESLNKNPLLIDVVSAGLFGGFFEGLSYPSLKIWMQQHHSNCSFLTAYKKIRHTTGFSSGISTVGVGTLLSSSFYFMGKHLAEHLEKGNPYFHQYPALACSVKGVSAQFFSTLIHEPVMLLVQHRHVNGGQDPLKKTIHDLFRQNTVFGIYRAAVPGFVVGCLSDALGFWFYQAIKKHYPEEMRQKVLPELFAYMAAFSAAMCFTVPFDVIATHLRFSVSKDPNIQKRFSEKTVSGVAKNIYKTQGLRGFWHALPATALHAGTVILMVPATELMGLSHL